MHLADRVRSGDRDALAEIASEHYADVYRFCARLLNTDLAEDAAQDTFAAAFRSIKRFRGGSSIRTWLFGIAVNVCRSERRRMKHHLSLQDWDYTEERPDARLVDIAALRSAVEKLDANQREAVVLHEMEGLTYAECAEALNVPEGTVKSRLHYAFIRLRDLLGESGVTL